MTNQEIIRRVQRLLALANSSNQHEAETAARKASELMIKYNLTLQETKASLDYTDDALDLGSREPTEAKYIYPILIEHFRVGLVKSRKNRRTVITILGTPENVEVAKYVFEFLSRTFRKLWEIDSACFLADHKQSYYSGLRTGLNEKLRETKRNVEQETGLVLVKDNGITKYMNQKFNNLRAGRRNYNYTGDQASRATGIDRGRNINIARGIGERSAVNGGYLK